MLDLIGPEKDVDGLHPLNIGRKFLKVDNNIDLALKRHTPLFYSCTPLGCLKLIQTVCDNLEGKRVTICGRSNIVGMPLALLLNKMNATVSICHSKTPNVEDYVRQADIFISAVGCPNFFKGEWLRKGAIAIDVGINEIYDEAEEPMSEECKKLSCGSYGGNRRIVGDIEFESAVERCSYITPVPGGVGPMTIAMLMNNLVESWEMSNFPHERVAGHLMSSKPSIP